MSPKPANPAVRTALIETAAHLLATDGPSGLTLRRLAAEVGTSTMAVYTHFGGMDELRRALRREGFSRLAAHQEAVGTSDDPVADIIGQGMAYYANATANPDLYRQMFMELPLDDVDAGTGYETFDVLVEAVRRCIDAGRFRPADPVKLAGQLWVTVHGAVSLQLANCWTAQEALDAIAAMGRNLMIAFGDDPEVFDRSVERALDRPPAAERGRVSAPADR